MTHYVSMIDDFMSGWGEAQGKTNILLIACETGEQADRVYVAALRRPEMSKVRVHASRPQYSPARYVVSERTWGTIGRVWKGAA